MEVSWSRAIGSVSNRSIMPANASAVAPWNAAVVSAAAPMTAGGSHASERRGIGSAADNAMSDPAMILLNGRLARIVHPLQMQSLLPQDLALKWRRIVASSDRRTITTDAPPAAAGGADPSLDPDEWSGLRA